MPPGRARILDAAERLLRTIGLARSTTKEIARAAGCSEAALYKHFRNKEDIFVRLLEERLPKLGPLLAELTEHPGERDMTENLTEIARGAAEFHASSVPIIVALYAEPTLLKRYNEGPREVNAGPRRPLDGLAGYLRAERAAGRLRPDADCDSATALLLGACCQRAFPLSTDESEPPARGVRRRSRPHGLRGIG
ncbi:TetR/AcrR family transcriptional regulator [Streptomyces buecherae]|uniref:TetR/AcrR family transcriptional regulator n=1 Tax=Streptomyces buecherae TaxID=2763006 RepID=UPI0036A9B25C